MKKYTIVILFILVANVLYAQQTFRETKYFSEEFTFKPGNKIKINGERTFVEIISVKSNKVKAEVEVISRSNDQAQALIDLEKIKVRIGKKGKTIFYSNILELNNPQEKPKSSLKTVLKLYVPFYTEVEIVNSYGVLTLNGAIGKVKSNSRFCTTKCTDFIGELELESEYGSIECLNSNMNLKLFGKRSDLTLTNTGGEIEGLVSYGTIDFSYHPDINFLNLRGEHSPVTIIVPEVLADGMEVKCENCSINIDNCNNISDEQISNKEHLILLDALSKKKLELKVNSIGEDIKIITSNTLSNYK
jgi:hypothetical protein